MKAKMKIIYPIIAIIMLGSIISSVTYAIALNPPNPQWVHLRYVTFGDAYQGRSQSLIRAIYRDAFYYADTYWQEDFQVPRRVWKFSGSEDFWHFTNIYEFNDFIEGRLVHNQYGRWSDCKGFLLLCETEHHITDMWGNTLVQWGNSDGSIQDYSWKMFVFLKTWRPSGIVNIPRDYVTQVIKREMMMGAGHGVCWIGWLFGGCLFESYGSWFAGHAQDRRPCYFCINAIRQIGILRGW